MRPLRTLVQRTSTIAATAVIATFVLAAPASATVGLGNGRAGSLVAGAVALVGAILACLALARPAGGRSGPLTAGATGLAGLVLGALHFAGTSGGFGTGSGRAGALVAMAVGLTALILSLLALARPRRAR